MSKMSQADRIILLEELFLNTKNHKLRINSVKKAYEKNNISLSDKTIYEDLKLIATCDKRDNNNWVLNSTTKINKQKNVYSILIINRDAFEKLTSLL